MYITFFQELLYNVLLKSTMISSFETPEGIMQQDFTLS